MLLGSTDRATGRSRPHSSCQLARLLLAREFAPFAAAAAGACRRDQGAAPGRVRIPGSARRRGAVVELVPDRPRGSARAGGLSQMLTHSHGSSRSSRGTDECAASSVLPFRTNPYLVPHAKCAGSTCSVQCRAERTHSFGHPAPPRSGGAAKLSREVPAISDATDAGDSPVVARARASA